MLAAGTQGRMMEWLKKVGPYWEELLTSPDLVGLVDTMLRYCLEVERRESGSTMEHILATIPSNKAKEKIMSLADELIEKGMERGMERGREVGRQEGREAGVLIGRIWSYQDLLNQAPDSVEELAKLKLEDLQAMAERLKAQLSSR